MLKIFLLASFVLPSVHAASLEHAINANKIKYLADLIDEQDHMEIIDPKAISLIFCIGTTSASPLQTIGWTDRFILWSSTVAALTGASIITNTFDFIGYEIAIRKRIYQTNMDTEFYQNLLNTGMKDEAEDYSYNMMLIEQRRRAYLIKFSDFLGWGF